MDELDNLMDKEIVWSEEELQRIWGECSSVMEFIEFLQSKTEDLSEGQLLKIYQETGSIDSFIEKLVVEDIL